MPEAALDSLLETRETFIAAVSRLADETVATALFDLFSRVAVLPYENVENTGTILLFPPNAPLPAIEVRFAQPFEIGDVRGLRKCLQITDGQLCLVSDCRMTYGFTPAESVQADILKVRFAPGGVWELSKDAQIIYQAPAPDSSHAPRAISRETLIRELHATFPTLSSEQTNTLCQLMDAALRQMRGTNVMVSADAPAEAARLDTQCTRVEPVPFTASLMERFTAIDGTVIIDTQGICHAIGAILDGDVTQRGDRARGGRYNSAVMYLDSTSVPSLIVVVSHDGTVDIVSSADNT